MAGVGPGFVVHDACVTSVLAPGTRQRGAAPSAAALRDVFLLDPEWTFLNHGSFGACPRPVFEAYQRFQLELERQPVQFLEREYHNRIDAARSKLAEYVGADLDGLVFVPNTTSGVNAVARSLGLRQGDEVVTTNHEYGACVLTWQAVCRTAGARLVVADLPDPLVDVESVVAALDAAVSDRTRVVFVSHLASMTAAVLPVREICRWARRRGLTSVVDGAHTPGQISLDLATLGADAYVGNCHKWLCAPKGSAFLWVADWLRERVEPLVVSWGCEEGSPFAARHAWSGTHDPAAALAVPAAIAFQNRLRWDGVRERGHMLAERLQDVLTQRFGLAPLYSGPQWHGQMISVPVPWPCEEAGELQRRLRENCRIEVPVFSWSGHTLVRASFQGYNDSHDLDRLVQALEGLF
jgi:isopenicillin-N epimerase